MTTARFFFAGRPGLPSVAFFAVFAAVVVRAFVGMLDLKNSLCPSQLAVIWKLGMGGGRDDAGSLR